MRPSWDEYFLDICDTVATRSTCDRAHVGALIVRGKDIISTGYNGAPSGEPHCDDEGHLMHDNHCIRTIHAEVNAVHRAGIKAPGATLYCSHKPCTNCEGVIRGAGITKIRYRKDY